MIPKILHFIWLGGASKPELVERCIASWKKVLPDFEIVEWNDELTKSIENRFFKEALSEKKWAFASDYLRLHVLNQFGGIYLDSDEEVFHDLSDFLDADFFTGFEDHRGSQFPVTALMGSVPGGYVIRDLLSHYCNKSFILPDGTLDMTPNTQLIADQFKSYGLLPPYEYDQVFRLKLDGKNIIYPSGYFCTPKNGVKSFAMHHFGGSWVDDFKLVFRVDLPIGLLALYKRKKFTGKDIPLPAGFRLRGMINFGRFYFCFAK